MTPEALLRLLCMARFVRRMAREEKGGPGVDPAADADLAALDRRIAEVKAMATAPPPVKP